ncbi:response regulator transcription factor [Sulfurospirillum sp. 1612]|uniref:response regulator transcription factor n=1 Tax=Sulfurospirillum sp. 1612 TaxID=3094835 RepID=UPI002F930FBF
MKILLLEDETMLRNSIREYLESLGHEIACFSNGTEAYEVLKKERYDLLLLDINVPKLNGLELLEALNKTKHATTTIFISAMIDIEDISHAYELGAADYLKKPFHLKELAFKINQIKKEQNARELQQVVLSKRYSFSKEKQLLFYNNSAQTLTKKQLQILTLLSQNLGIVVDFEKFRSFVWKDEPVDNATIRAEISRLRKSLKEDFIVNMKGVGYKIEKYFV